MQRDLPSGEGPLAWFREGARYDMEKRMIAHALESLEKAGEELRGEFNALCQRAPSPEGGQWIVDKHYLKKRVYRPVEGSEGGFGSSSSDKSYGNAPSIKSGPYATDPTSGEAYDPFAPKTPTPPEKKSGGESGGSPKGKRTMGPAGGSATEADTFPVS